MQKKEMILSPNNIMSRDIPNEKIELVTISGLQFKPYQMQCMELLAKVDGYNNVKKWLNDKIISELLVPSLENLDNTSGQKAKDMLARLRKDGYGNRG